MLFTSYNYSVLKLPNFSIIIIIIIIIILKCLIFLQVEYEAVNITLINFTNISFGGSTPQLAWGKWVVSPTFPLKSTDSEYCSATGVRIC